MGRNYGNFREGSRMETRKMQWVMVNRMERRAWCHLGSESRAEEEKAS